MTGVDFDRQKLAEDLAAYVGGVPSSDYLTQCIAVAWEWVGVYIGSAAVPAAIRRRAIVEVAAELYHRKSAPNGIKNFADMESAPVRVRIDALAPVRPMLAPYLGVGLA